LYLALPLALVSASPPLVANALRWCKTRVATTTGNSAVAILEHGSAATTSTLPIRIIDVVRDTVLVDPNYWR
jgi:hypothetical protein